jgi:16S rRNA (guanine527-N7)-methyltransferase
VIDDETARLYDPYVLAISRYVDILLDRGISWGLLGPREADRVWQRHVLNSAALRGLVPDGATVVDIGSGAGLPGIPLAILRPDLMVTLLEPLLRRSDFLSMAVEELDLGDRVRVVRARAEEHQSRYDIVTSRAVAPLGKLLRWSTPLMHQDGQILALKGSSAADEVAASAADLRSRRLVADVVSARAHPQAEIATVVRIRRSR